MDDRGDRHRTREPAVQPGPRFVRAVAWAATLHAGQVKKGTDTPYIAHLLGVAALVLEHGGTETEAIAALLHDAVEDTGVTTKQVRKRFGRKVAKIVDGCTDTRDGGRAKPGKRGPDAREGRDAKSWWKRKRRIIRHLDDPETPASVVRVKAADALWNARSVVADLRRHGPEVWERFHAGAADQLWYYRSTSTVVSRRLPGALADELRTAVGEMERVAGWWFDVGDPQDA